MVLVVAIVALLVAVGLYCYHSWTLRRMTQLSKDVPTFAKPLPLIGHGHYFFGDNQHIFNTVDRIVKFTNQQGGLSKFLLGTKLIYSVTDPEDATVVLNTCLEKSIIYDFAKSWLGDGLITGSVSVWKIHHKKLLPAFKQNVINNFLGIFNKQSSVLAEVMGGEVEHGWFDPTPYIGAATLETICQTAMGTPMGQQSIANPPYLRAITKLFDLYIKRIGNPCIHPDFIYRILGLKKIEDDTLKILKHVSTTVVQKKREEEGNKQNDKDESNKKNNPQFRAFLDLVLELNAKAAFMTDEEIRQEVDTIIAAGQETTAYGTQFSLIMLGSHQDKQQKVYDEIQAIIGNSDRDVTKEDLSKMVYLEAFVNETLRLYPVVMVIIRMIDRDLKLKNYTLAAGSSCMVMIWGLHRHKRWGPDYNEFRPERWFDPASLPDNPAAFCPFSLGRRMCIGKSYAMMSMKIMLIHVLRKYRVYCDGSLLKLKLGITIKPSSGNFIKLERR